MSKKKALYYILEPLKGRPQYATMHFFDRKQRKMLSSVDLVLNLDYLDDRQIFAFVENR